LEAKGWSKVEVDKFEAIGEEEEVAVSAVDELAEKLGVLGHLVQTASAH
jgi:hypothetical protein|tara:strand:- start:1589 stop:1735 length:147 start_codon:yes stop_codon:yes gene_type:complete